MGITLNVWVRALEGPILEATEVFVDTEFQNNPQLAEMFIKRTLLRQFIDAIEECTHVGISVGPYLEIVKAVLVVASQQLYKASLTVDGVEIHAVEPQQLNDFNVAVFDLILKDLVAWQALDTHGKMDRLTEGLFDPEYVHVNHQLPIRKNDETHESHPRRRHSPGESVRTPTEPTHLGDPAQQRRQEFPTHLWHHLRAGLCIGRQ